MSRRDLRTPYPFHALPGSGLGYRPAPQPVPRASFVRIMVKLAMACLAVVLSLEFGLTFLAAFTR